MGFNEEEQQTTPQGVAEAASAASDHFPLAIGRLEALRCPKKVICRNPYFSKTAAICQILKTSP